jgi:hypothetical protein
LDRRQDRSAGPGSQFWRGARDSKNSIAVSSDWTYLDVKPSSQNWSHFMHFALLLLQDQPDPEQIRRIAMGVLAIMPIIVLVGMAIVVLPFWFICKKAGFSPWLSLLNFVPAGGLILLYVLAFADWKVAPMAPPQLNYPYSPPPPRV